MNDSRPFFANDRPYAKELKPEIRNQKKEINLSFLVANFWFAFSQSPILYVSCRRRFGKFEHQTQSHEKNKPRTNTDETLIRGIGLSNPCLSVAKNYRAAFCY